MEDNDYDDDNDIYDRVGVADDFLDLEDEGDEGDEGDKSDAEFDEDENVPSDHHKIKIRQHPITDPIMTKYELARLAGSLGELYATDPPMHPALLKIVSDKKLIDPLDIACEHLLHHPEIPCPIQFKRPFPNGRVEVGDFHNMILPHNVKNYNFLQL